MMLHVCEVEGCERLRTMPNKPWCSGHLTRVRRTGEPGPVDFRLGGAPVEVCCVVGCGWGTTAKGMCLNHFRQWKKHGDPLYRHQQAKGEDHKWWLGDDIGYIQAHLRVRKARGPAKTYTCEDCGQRAKHWAYDHQDPDEKLDEKGLPYSVKVEHYRSLCVPCHKRIDVERVDENASVKVVALGPRQRELLADMRGIHPRPWRIDHSWVLNIYEHRYTMRALARRGLVEQVERDVYRLTEGACRWLADSA